MSSGLKSSGDIPEPGAHPDAGWNAIFMTIVLVLIALVVQSVVSFMFFLYCDENVQPGTSRELVCHAADDGGYLATVLLPPVTVMVAGVVAFRRRRTGAVVWVFALAMLVGIAVPLMTTVVAG